MCRSSSTLKKAKYARVINEAFLISVSDCLFVILKMLLMFSGVNGSFGELGAASIRLRPAITSTTIGSLIGELKPCVKCIHATELMNWFTLANEEAECPK